MAGLPPKAFKKAVDQEKQRFEQFYLWLEKSMPDIFFQEVAQEWIPLIVHSLMGFQEQDCFAEIHLKNAAISLCLDNPESDISILKRYPMYGIKNYTTYVSSHPLPLSNITANLRIATLYFTETLPKEEPRLESTYEEELLALLQKRNANWPAEKGISLIEEMDQRFIRKMPLERQVLALEMFERAKSRDNCQYEVLYEENWNEKGEPSMQIVLAWKNVPKHNFLYRLVTIVHRHHLDIRRINAAYLKPHKIDCIFMLSFGLHGQNGQAAWEATDISDFLQELVMLKYFGSCDSLDTTFIQTGMLSGNQGNFLRALLNFVHQILTNVDLHLYTLENIEEGLCRHPELTTTLVDIFESKFHPTKLNLKKFEESQEHFHKLLDHLDTGHEHNDLRRKNILLQSLNFIEHILKTNFYKNNKTALSFRLDPNYLNHVPFEREKIFPEIPFGIFYIKGMHFIGFHVRFKDLSRGGLRTIFPQKKEHMLAERNTVFNECYNLALTQHKKNKDIPEGGAKSVIFLKPYNRLKSEGEILARELSESGIAEEEIEKKLQLFIQTQKMEYLYQTQRSFIKALLSLINCNAEGVLKAKNIIDYWKKPEYIYLGPDENMHDCMIEWIAKESRKEHYKPGGAFISGKSSIGINHKEYGVTSLGVNVYMDSALKFLNIDPKKEHFTIKMTGGPDGDVGGNQIFNLYKHYPKTAKLIALTDISGTINDPQGLDLEICINLFKERKSIRFYPPEKLSKGAFLLDRQTKRELSPYAYQTLLWQNKKGEISAKWLSGNEMNSLFRNNVHQTRADVFIPCGGRPQTLRESNYKEFLDPTGIPTAKIIVEGANLYFSNWVRKYFESQNVLIFKDSSANKCGVICSSFEILFGLILSDQQFLKYKGVLVDEVLERLKFLAASEAELILQNHQISKKPLSIISDEISKRINYFTDQLLDYLSQITLSDNIADPLIRCFLSYCPKILHEEFQRELISEIPDNHKKAIIASHIAYQLVYQKGLLWFPTLVDILPLILQDEQLFK